MIQVAVTSQLANTVVVMIHHMLHTYTHAYMHICIHACKMQNAKCTWLKVGLNFEGECYL